jgi:hypothetical protein
MILAKPFRQSFLGRKRLDSFYVPRECFLTLRGIHVPCPNFVPRSSSDLLPTHLNQDCQKVRNLFPLPCSPPQFRHLAVGRH